MFPGRFWFTSRYSDIEGQSAIIQAAIVSGVWFAVAGIFFPEEPVTPDAEIKQAFKISVQKLVIGLLGLDLAVLEHSTLSCRAKTLEAPPLRRATRLGVHQPQLEMQRTIVWYCRGGAV